VRARRKKSPKEVASGKKALRKKKTAEEGRLYKKRERTTHEEEKSRNLKWSITLSRERDFTLPTLKKMVLGKASNKSRTEGRGWGSAMEKKRSRGEKITSRESNCS